MEQMGRASSTFRQTDVVRALKAVRAAGYSAVRVLVDKTGRIEITTKAEGEAQGEPSDSSNSWDEVLNAEDAKRAS
jgi:hypothetical protein